MQKDKLREAKDYARDYHLGLHIKNNRLTSIYPQTPEPNDSPKSPRNLRDLIPAPLMGAATGLGLFLSSSEALAVVEGLNRISTENGIGQFLLAAAMLGMTLGKSKRKGPTPLSNNSTEGISMDMSQLISRVSNEPFLTVKEDGCIVPWLAAKGPYSYSPETPPSDGKMLDYVNILPELYGEHFNDFCGLNNGASINESPVYEFWQAAKHGRIERVYYSEGKLDKDGFEAPIAVYKFRIMRYPFYALVQSGSFQVVDVDLHPEIERGVVHIGRGVRRNSCFEMPRLENNFTSSNWETLNSLYFLYQWFSFSVGDKAHAFAHQRVHKAPYDNFPRKERDYFHDLFRDWLEENKPGVGMKDLREIERNAAKSFSLLETVYQGKFGPNFGILETPINNIRLTNYPWEGEVCLINPNKAEKIN
jgi:hypothetical protein